MRWLKWCGKMVITVILVSTLTMLTTGLIVQSYVNSLLASFNIAWEGQPSGLTSIFQGALGMNSSNKAESTEQQKEAADDNAAAKQVDHSQGSSGEGNDSAPDSAGSADKGAENSEDPENPEDPVIMSPDDMAEYKNTIPNKEKTEVFDLLMNKVPTDEMQLIANNMENGITEQELQDMEQVIAKYLTEEEYKQLMAILTPEQ